MMVSVVSIHLMERNCCREWKLELGKIDSNRFGLANRIGIGIGISIRCSLITQYTLVTSPCLAIDSHDLITYLTVHLYHCPAFNGFRLSAKAVELNVATVAGQMALCGSAFWWTFPLGFCLVYIFFVFLSVCGQT